MTREELSLLRYFECCAVDLNGRVDARRMNEADFEIAESWNESGFVKFGRIVTENHNRQGAHWCELSEEAWAIAHKERRDKAERMTRRFTRTCERNAA